MNLPQAAMHGAPRRIQIMGIVNVTPDSFSDGGDFQQAEAAIAQGRALAAEGADIVDVGGESTRPGHQPVGPEEEQRRIAPVVEGLAPLLDIPVSIDTYRAATAELALRLGARIVNDVWGLQGDDEMAAVAASHNATVVAMHNRREVDPDLDIGDEMRRFFEKTLERASRAGLPPEQIILDPGIGFGKSFEQNLDAIRRLDELKSLGHRVLVGASRKSFLQRFLDQPTPPKARLCGTLGAHAAAVAAGADIIRAHDVRAHVEMLRVFSALNGASR